MAVTPAALMTKSAPEGSSEVKSEFGSELTFEAVEGL
jgi:hypothetical protein